MKLLILVAVLVLSILFVGALFQFIWNDALVYLFDFKEISLMHSIEIGVGMRLLFQTFEFETRE